MKAVYGIYLLIDGYLGLQSEVVQTFTRLDD